MIPTNSYLIRAFYDNIVDNDLTPHIHVHVTDTNGVDVPDAYVQDDFIVLNIAPRAVSAFKIDKEAVSFQARFNGQPTNIYVPIQAIRTIYSREMDECGYTRIGTELPAMEADIEDIQPEAPSPSKRPTLTIVE